MPICQHVNLSICFESITVSHRGIGTCISEASKKVPIVPFATQRVKQESSNFGQEIQDKLEGSDPAAWSRV